MNDFELTDTYLNSASKTWSGKKAEFYLERAKITLDRLRQTAPSLRPSEVAPRRLRYLESRYELTGDNNDYDKVIGAYSTLQAFNPGDKVYCSFIKFKESHLQLKEIISPENVYNTKWDLTSSEILKFRRDHVTPAFKDFTKKYANATDSALYMNRSDRSAECSITYIGESLRQFEFSACRSGFRNLKFALEAQKKNVPKYLIRTAFTGLVGECRRISRKFTYNLQDRMEVNALQSSNPLKF